MLLTPRTCASAYASAVRRINLAIQDNGNTCLSIHRRRQDREAREFGDELTYLPIPAGYEDDPESAAMAEERREELLRALEQVRAEYRAAVVLRHMEGLSYAEIARILEVPDGTAKGWVNRGRAALLVALTEEEGGGENPESGARPR